MSRSHTLSHPFPRDRVVRPRASRVPRASHPGDRPRSIAAPRPPPPPVETHPSTDRVVSPRLRHRRRATSSMRRTVRQHRLQSPPVRAPPSRAISRARARRPAGASFRPRANARRARATLCARDDAHDAGATVDRARARGALARAARRGRSSGARAETNPRAREG